MADRTRTPREVAVRFQRKDGKASPRQASGGNIMVMKPVVVTPDFEVPAAVLSIAFTRHLDGDDSAESARTTPSAVELRVDTRIWTGLSPEDCQRLVGFPRLMADRRGTLRVMCSDHPSRSKNLEGARERLAWLIKEAWAAPLTAPQSKPKRRRRSGLNKAVAVATTPAPAASAVDAPPPLATAKPGVATGGWSGAKAKPDA